MTQKLQHWRQMRYGLPEVTADVLEYLQPSSSTHSNLETETQLVSQGIMSLQSSVVRLHVLIANDSNEGCCASLTHILMDYRKKFGLDLSPGGASEHL